MPGSRRALLVGGGLAAAAAVAPPRGPRASDALFPTRPVRVIVPFAAGGSGDITARLIGRQISLATGHPMIVENMAGGNGVVGTLAVLNAPADGHTLLLATTTTMSANHALLRSPPYDAARDFAVVAVFGNTAGCLMVSAASPYATVQDLVAQIRSEPGRLNSGWFTGSSRIPAALLKRVAGLDFEEVAYRAIGGAISDLQSGQIQFIFIDMVAADAPLRSGQFRALAVTMPRRLPHMPDVPAMNELYRGFEMAGLLGFAVRSGTPNALKEAINRRAVAAVAAPEVSARLREMSVEPATMDLAQAAAYAAREREKWARIVRLADIEPE